MAVEENAVELVIFDCDGVLVDSETLSARVSQRVLADLGCELPLEEVLEQFAGSSAEVYQARVADLLGRPLEPDWELPYRDWYADAFRSELRPVAGIRDCLRELRLPRCVASNSSHRRIRETLAMTGILEHFDGLIFSAEDVASGKPAPDVFLWAAKNLGVHPDNCVVVEDSVFGVQAARAAGMRVLAYSGVTRPDRLAGERTIVFDSMPDVPRLIGSLSPSRAEVPAAHP